MNVDTPFSWLSLAPTRANTASTTVISASRHGTKQPSCARRTTAPIYTHTRHRLYFSIKQRSLTQGSYRNVTVVFQTFPVQNYFFFQAFQGILFIFMQTKTLQKLAIKCSKFLYNVFFYSKYRMGLKFLNFELQILCIMNCKKINKCIGNQQCNRHLHFPGQHYSFHRFFQTFPYQWSFSRLFKALKISTLNSRTFDTFPGSVRTLSLSHWSWLHTKGFLSGLCWIAQVKQQ